MDNDKKTQYTVITVVVLLLLVVIAVTILFIINANKENSLKVKINQIYSSDYKLTAMGDYFIGTYNDKTISVVINNSGEEVYKTIEDIPYDNIYLLKDDNYLIYNTNDNNLNVYIFNGEEIKTLYSIKNVNNIKPIIYKNSYQEYIVGFVSVTETDTYLYNINDGNVVIIKDALLVGDSINEDKYYAFSNKYLVMKNADNLMGAVDYSGNLVIPYEYKNMINTYNDSFIVQNDKDLYGIISNKGEELVKVKYKAIDLYENYYLIVNKNNKMAIYSKDCTEIVDFKLNYDSLLDFDLRNNVNSIKLYRAGGRLFIVNNYMEDANKTEYEKHNLYVVKDGKVVETIKELGFGVNNYLIYIYDKEYNIKVYDTDFNLLFKVKLDDVKKINDIKLVSNTIYQVNYVLNDDKEEVKYYDNQGQEVEFNQGKLVLKNDEYLAYLKENNGNYELKVVDNKDNVLDSITGSKVDIKGNFVIVDNAIYEIVKKEN